MSYHTKAHRAENRLTDAAQQQSRTASSSPYRNKVTYTGVLKQVLGLGLRTRFRKAASFILRLAAYPLLSLRWYEFLVRFASEHQLGLPHDDIIRKAIPHFFIRKAPSRERLRLLQNHFSLAGQVMAIDDLRNLWAGGQISYGTVEGKKEQYDISLRLSDHAGARHEGGFTIILHRRSDEVLLCMLSFIFIADNYGRVTVAIGGLQGTSGEDAKRVIIDATRDLYGVRPKDALLLIAEGMAGKGGADHFLAVANASHVINFRNSSRRMRMRSDLDSYWAERGGEVAGRFGYVLPLRNTKLLQATAKRDLCKLKFLLTGKLIMAVTLDAAK